MKRVLNVLTALITLCARSAYFSSPHRLLPERVRFWSAGNLALTAAFFAVSVLRYNVLAVGIVNQHLQGLGLFYVMVILLFGRNWRYVSIFLAASVGVDITMSALTFVGIDSASTTSQYISSAWEWCAALYGIALAALHKKLSAQDSSAATS